MAASSDSLLEFPCEFAIKVMGEAAEGFESMVVELVRPHIPNLAPTDITRKASRKGKYVSLTVSLYAQSQAQLDQIYRVLSNHERVLMVL